MFSGRPAGYCLVDGFAYCLVDGLRATVYSLETR